MSSLALVPRLRDESLSVAWLDFYQSRRAQRLSQNTLNFYSFTARKFVEWLGSEAGLVEPAELQTRHVRDYLIGLGDRGLQAGGIRAHGRAIKTLVNFWCEEGWLPEDTKIKVEMPEASKERQAMVTAEDAQRLLDACETHRERALVYLLLDSGVRRAEACALNWGDVDLKTGLVQVRLGKGRKPRSVFLSPTTLRALLRYRRQVPHDDADPIFQSERGGARLTGSGLRGILSRLGRRAGVKLTVHAFRRGFATLSLRAGMSPLHLQGLLGHTSLEMVRRYVQLVDDDLKQAHQEHSPVEKWLR